MRTTSENLTIFASTIKYKLVNSRVGEEKYILLTHTLFFSFFFMIFQDFSVGKVLFLTAFKVFFFVFSFQHFEYDVSCVDFFGFILFKDWSGSWAYGFMSFANLRSGFIYILYMYYPLSFWSIYVIYIHIIHYYIYIWLRKKVYILYFCCSDQK